jgi:MoxR-like ATPase
MGVLKKKEERTETVTIRIASSVKAEIDQLRERAEATGFDLNATMSESLTRLVRQVREELDGIAAAPNPRGNRARAPHVNGLTRVAGELSPASSGGGNGE